MHAHVPMFHMTAGGLSTVSLTRMMIVSTRTAAVVTAPTSQTGPTVASHRSAPSQLSPPSSEKKVRTNAPGGGPDGEGEGRKGTVTNPFRAVPGTLPILAYQRVCQERDMALQERYAARVAARATFQLKTEPLTLHEDHKSLQNKVLGTKHARTTADARCEVLSCLKQPNPTWVVAARLGPPQAIIGHSVRFLVFGLMGYAQLRTRLLPDAGALCSQLRTVARLPSRTKLPDLNMHNLPTVGQGVPDRAGAAYARF